MNDIQIVFPFHTSLLLIFCTQIMNTQKLFETSTILTRALEVKKDLLDSSAHTQISD